MRVEFQDPPPARPDQAAQGGARLVAEAEIVFEGEPLLAGLKLGGFSVRRTRRGGVFVLGPAKVYGPPGSREFLDLLRSVDPDVDWNIATEAIRNHILAEYHRQRGEASDVA